MSPRFQITKESIIADVLREYPECIEVFNRHNMPCQTCMGASTGTIADGSMMHNVDPDVIVAELIECCRQAEGDSTSDVSS